MSFLLLCAVLQPASDFSATPAAAGARVVLTSARPSREMKGVRCRWTVFADAIPAASGPWPLRGLAAGHPVTNAVPEAVAAFRARGCDVALRVRFVTGKADPDEETLLGVSQIDWPRTRARPLPDSAGRPAELSETADAYVFKTPSERIRFDRATGLLSGYATGWWSLTEWLKRPMAFDFGDPSPRIRLETFTVPVETNGVWSFRTVSWWKMSAGRQGCRPNGDAASGRTREVNFEIRVATDWRVRGDGRVVSRTAIRPFGLRHILPRVGWAFVLAPPAPLVQYYGCGAAKDAKDGFHKAIDGLYSTSVAGCGSHERTRAVAFDAGSDHFALSTLGENFFLEVGPTPSKATFCGIVAERQAETDHDWRIDLLISPEKTLQAYE